MAKTKKWGSPKPSQTHLYVIIAVLTLVSVALLHRALRVSGVLARTETIPSTCEKTGSPVINVTQKVINSVDSGEAGNYWAFDNYNRTIQVWNQTNGSYCALVNYDGKFDAQSGQRSPGDTAVLTGSEDGNFKGGYRAIIHGSLLPTPAWSTKGTLGSIDYQCTIAGNCPGAIDWTSQYFATSATGYTFDYAWWGWEYHTTGQKTWVNSSEGNSGDVL